MSSLTLSDEVHAGYDISATGGNYFALDDGLFLKHPPRFLQFKVDRRDARFAARKHFPDCFDRHSRESCSRASAGRAALADIRSVHGEPLAEALCRFAGFQPAAEIGKALAGWFFASPMGPGLSHIEFAQASPTFPFSRAQRGRRWPKAG
jgi:hypothetical protein